MRDDNVRGKLAFRTHGESVDVYFVNEFGTYTLLGTFERSIFHPSFRTKSANRLLRAVQRSERLISLEGLRL